MPERTALEALFVEQLPLIDRTVGSICRRHGLPFHECEDFSSYARVRLIQDDYAVLQKHRGESSLGTFLVAVIVRLYREYRVRHWGRWRPSAAAVRLGPTAIRLETLLFRDRCTFRQAVEILRSAGITASDAELRALLVKLPPRSPLRPREVESDTIGPKGDASSAESDLAAAEDERERQKVERVLHEAVNALPSEDRVLLQLRFWEGLSVADISRTLGMPQKPLYRRMQRLLAELREKLEAQGVNADFLRSFGL